MILFACFSFYILFSFWLIHSILTNVYSNLHFSLAIILFVVSLFFLTHILVQAQQIRAKWKIYSMKFDKDDKYILLSVIVGAYLTFTLNHTLGMGGVLASSLIGLGAATTVRKYAVPVYCGSFIGMACNLIFSNPLAIGLAALISGMLFILSEPLFDGYGGKCGFMAFVGTYTVSLFTPERLRVINPLEPRLYLYVFLITIIAGISTYALQSTEKMDAVSASALIGLIVSLLYPDPSHVIVISAFCASFTGMTSKEHFDKKIDIVLATLITALLYVAAFSLFDGSGGKLGALAFMATVSTGGIKQFTYVLTKAVDFIRQKRSTRQTGQTGIKS